MINNEKLLIIIMLLMNFSVVFGQPPKKQDDYARKINREAINLVHKYERAIIAINIEISDKQDRGLQEKANNLKGLFVNDNAMVANDILPDNLLDFQIPIRKYTDTKNKFILGEGEYKSNIDILYVSPITFNRDGFSGEVSVYVRKNIEKALTKHGTLYSDSIRLNITVSFDSLHYNAFHIKEITPLDERGKYCIVGAYTKGLLQSPVKLKNAEVIAGGDTIPLDSSGRFLLRGVKNNLVVTSSNPDLLAGGTIAYEDLGKAHDIAGVDEGEDKNLRKIYLRQPLGYIEATVGVQPDIAPIRFDASSLPDIKIRSSNHNYSVGARGGVIFWTSPKVWLSIYTGVQQYTYNYTLSIDSYSFSYKDVDPDEWEYLRTNRIYDISEKHSVTLIGIPVGFNSEVALSRDHRVIFGLGLGYYFLSGEYSITAMGEYSGYYDDLFGITIAENGVYDFGVFELENKESLPVNKSIWTYNVYAGYKYRWTRRTFVQIKADYFFSGKSILKKNPFNKKMSRDYSEVRSLLALRNEWSSSLNSLSLTAGILIRI